MFNSRMTPCCARPRPDLAKADHHFRFCPAILQRRAAVDPCQELLYCQLLQCTSFNAGPSGSVLRCRLKPVFDRSFPLWEIVAAFEYYESQKHFGKVCLEL
jgi:hypothetical protein